LDALYGAVAGKPFVLEDFVFSMGTSVASALTVETVFEIIKCMSDVDMSTPVTRRCGAGVRSRLIASAYSGGERKTPNVMRC